MNNLWYEEMNMIYGELAKDKDTEALYHVERSGHVEVVGFDNGAIYSIQKHTG